MVVWDQVNASVEDFHRNLICIHAAPETKVSSKKGTDTSIQRLPYLEAGS